MYLQFQQNPSIDIDMVLSSVQLVHFSGIKAPVATLSGGPRSVYQSVTTLPRHSYYQNMSAACVLTWDWC